jgi:hypothetical protein
MSADAPAPAPERPTAAQRIAARIEKNLLVVLGGVVIGAFLAGIGTLAFVQKVVKDEVESHWKGQVAALAKGSVDEQVKARFGSREPALVRTFRNGLNECLRVNDLQYCWGRETRTPKWDDKTEVNVVDYTFTFAAPFDGTPVVTMGAYPTGNRKVWGVYHSSRTASGFVVRAMDMTRGPKSEEHVLISYIAVGNPGKE